MAVEEQSPGRSVGSDWPTRQLNRKVALLLGREAGQAYLASRGLAAWLIDYQGCPVTIGQQQRFKQGETQ